MILSADCCHVADQQRRTYYESNSNSILGEYAVEFAVKLAGKLDLIKNSKRKLALLEHITLDWLVACVSEYILLTFHQKNLNVDMYRKPEPLSLQKIVSRRSTI